MRALRRRRQTDEQFEEERRRLAALIRDRIEAEAGQQIGAARATLKQTVSESDPVFLLQPSNPSAAPLEAHVDSGQSVFFLPGRSGMTYEVYSHDFHELEEEARLLARAVVEGTYRERVHRRPPDEAVAGWPPDELQAHRAMAHTRWNGVAAGRDATGECWIVCRIDTQPDSRGLTGSARALLRSMAWSPAELVAHPGCAAPPS